MPPETVGRGFEPFFTSTPIGQGTGLGLSMIYGFASQSGGQDRIHSAVGVGTTMRIDLPQFAETVEADARKEEQTTVPRAGDGGTVPVIDDEGATVGAFGRRTSASRRSACNP